MAKLITGPFRDKIINDYEEGMSIFALSKKYPFTRLNISLTLKRNGVKLRHLYNEQEEEASEVHS